MLMYSLEHLEKKRDRVNCNAQQQNHVNVTTSDVPVVVDLPPSHSISNQQIFQPSELNSVINSSSEESMPPSYHTVLVSETGIVSNS